MKKAAHKKRSVAPSRKHHKRNTAKYTFMGYSIIVLGVFLLFVFVKFGYSSLNSSHVLGASTLLARGGDDGGGDSSGGSGGSDSSGSGSGGSDTQSGGGHGDDNSTSQSEDAPEQHEQSENTFIAPHESETSETELARLHHSGPELSKEERKAAKKADKLERKVRKGKDGNVDLSDRGGSVSARVRNEDGTEEEIGDDKDLRRINKALKDDDVSLERASDSGNFIIKRGRIAAESHFPLSIDLATRILTVTTPAGVKQVAVLPDKAVEHLLKSHIIDKLQVTDSSSSDEAKIQLTAVNNQPVFVVKGVTNKHFLGLFPVGIHKTVDVSAETGTVVKTDESLGQRLLDLLSF